MTLTRNRTHSKAYLEALLQPSPSAIAGRPHLQRTPSTTGFSGAVAASGVDAYKPVRSSGLAASSGTGTDADVDNDDDLNLDLVLDEGRSLHQGLSAAQEGNSSGIFKHQDQEREEEISRYPPSEADSTDEPSVHLRISTVNSFSRRSSTAGSDGVGGGDKESVRVILALLDDESLDDEERIESVRTELATKLKAVEGADVSTGRLDDIVLALLHRHREDVKPTGASFVSLSSPSPSPFPASPRSRPRPASIRSVSGANMGLNAGRPWGPVTPTSTTAPGQDPPSRPSSPQSQTTSSNYNPNVGVIGTPSPKASPSLWHRTVAAASGGGGSSSGITGTALGNGASSKGTANNPWSSSPSSSATSPFAAAFGSNATSLFSNPSTMAPLSSPKMTPAMSRAVGSVISRPGSPSMTGSPRLNVGASEFKPRTPQAVHATPTKRPSSPYSSAQQLPWATADTEGIASSSTAGAQSDEDSDHDEFSPFAAAAASSSSSSSSATTSGGGGGAVAVPVPFSSGNGGRRAMARGRPNSMQTASTSSVQSLTTAESFGAPGEHPPSNTSGSWYSSASTSLGSSDEQRPKLNAATSEEEFEGITMTPFDVLSSILTQSGSSQGISWTAEQIEEALASSNWDIDATLKAIMDGGGMPLASAPAPALSSSASSSTGLGKTPPTGPRSPAGGQRFAGGTPGRSGVSVVPREALAAQKAMPPSGPRSSSSAPWATGSNAPPPPPRAGPLSGPAQLGAGRVCRYFLAGECRRADCRFSHDLNRALCRFWLRGQCLNGDGCSFLHDISVVDALASGVSNLSAGNGAPNPSPASSSVEPETPPNEDFPELGLSAAPLGPKAQRNKASSSGQVPGQDPSRSRWAAALRGKAPTPLALYQQGEAATSVGKSTATNRPPPLGPRATSSSSSSSPFSTRLPLRPCALLPTLATGKAASQAYHTYRENALSLSDRRNRCLARAAEAWRRGDGAGARKWSNEGQTLNRSIQEEGTRAAMMMLKERHEELRERMVTEGASSTTGASSALAERAAQEEGSARGMRGKAIGNGLGICLGVVPRSYYSNAKKGPAATAAAASTSLTMEERTEVLMDLHGLHAHEATELVEDFLVSLEREQFRGLAFLACGVGKHTGAGGNADVGGQDRRRVGLAGAVKAFLASWNYPHIEHEGVITVDPLTHL
ncbi:hypothetical protein FA10DRAFT_66394 [Acaromyces ingoldii]|uniref:C3H1-type domain-containing protein n=1 Tax=Acaromyces ingoldii TaxID=215250 RepID=A0A316YRF0_9BASI|nr:hypothetical protein FA10DRAFT_66394 [Acaromyces ingoldii]PWN91394.1 hypothetical protein FA10DRAFT_66394 [Acaromyces ingoldii]